MTWPGTRARSGTTVIELVVALLITGVVAAAGAAAFRQAIDRRTQLLSSATATERTAARRGMLREWLSTGTLIWPPDSTGLVFTTTSAPQQVPPGTTLRLYVDDDARTPERGLVLAFRRADNGPVERREIDAQITRVSTEYYDAEAERWVSATEASPARPAAVRLTFVETAEEDNANSPVVHDRLRELPLTVLMSSVPVAAARNGPEERR